jgi:1-acyl-sn-glycerol-3-phosphate acyltransferase
VRTPVLNVLRPALHLAGRAYFGLRIRGAEHIPADGPLLVTPNHQTYADPPLVTIPFRRPVYYMAWEALFEVPLLSWAIRRLRAFPVAVGAVDATAIRQAVRLLAAGEVLMIFPEGGRSPDGRLQEFKLGAFRLATAHGIPVLPVTIAGGTNSWPPGRRLPRPGRITVTFHPVLPVPRARDPKAAARGLADRARAAIASALPAALLT